MRNRALILLSHSPSSTEISKWAGQNVPVNKDTTEEIFNMKFSDGYVNPAALRSERWVICSCLSSPAQ